MIHNIMIDKRGNVLSNLGVEGGKLSLVKYMRNRDILVLHESGHNYWAARGITSYEPSKYLVLKVEKGEDRGEFWILRCEELVEIYVRSKKDVSGWKESLAAELRKFNNG